MLFRPESKESRESLTTPVTGCWVIKRVEFLPALGDSKSTAADPSHLDYMELWAGKGHQDSPQDGNIVIVKQKPSLSL